MVASSRSKVLSFLLLVLLRDQAFARPNPKHTKGFFERRNIDVKKRTEGRVEIVDHTHNHDITGLKHITKSKATHLSYRAERHHPDDVHIWNLDEEKSGAENVLFCNDAEIIIEVDEHKTRTVRQSSIDEFLKANKHVVLVAHPAWECTNSSKPADPILRLVTSWENHEGNPPQIRLQTKPATYHHVFKELNLKFRNNAWHQDVMRHDLNPEKVTPVVRRLRGRRLGFWSWLRNAVRRVFMVIKKVVMAVVNAIKTAVKIGKCLTGWCYMNEKKNLIEEFKFSWNKELGDATVKCIDCSASADLTVNFELDVKSYKTQKFELSLVGDAKLNLDTQFDFTHHSVIKKYEKLMGTINGPATVFYVFGVAFAVSLHIPVTIGYEVVLDAKATVRVIANGAGKIKFGVTKADERMSWKCQWRGVLKLPFCPFSSRVPSPYLSPHDFLNSRVCP